MLEALSNASTGPTPRHRNTTNAIQSQPNVLGNPQQPRSLTRKNGAQLIPHHSNNDFSTAWQAVGLDSRAAPQTGFTSDRPLQNVDAPYESPAVQNRVLFAVSRTYQAHKSWLKSRYWPKLSSQAPRLEWTCVRFSEAQHSQRFYRSLTNSGLRCDVVRGLCDD